MNQLRIAVIGAGHLGRIHARLLPQIEGVRLVVVADPSPAVQRELIATTAVPIISDYRKIVNEIDAAIIATPTRNHFDIAADLLSRSIHCLIEKPITDCPYQAAQLQGLAEQHNCVLAVGHVEQFNPAIQLAFERVGEPKFIQSCRTSGYTFRSTDIGVVNDLMIHDIDLVNTAFPGRLIQIQACGFSVFGGHEDIAQARLQFDCGGVANLTASRCSFSAERNMLIFGTAGFAAVDLANHKIKSIRFPGWLKQQRFNFQSVTVEQREFIKEQLFTRLLPVEESVPERTNAILEEQINWISAILKGDPVRNTAANATEAVRIAVQVLDQIDRHEWHGNSTGHIFPESENPEILAFSDELPVELQPPITRAA